MNGFKWPNEVNEGWLKGFYRFLSIIGSLFMAQLLSLADHDLSRLEKDKYQNKQKMPAFMRLELNHFKKILNSHILRNKELKIVAFIF